MNETAQPKVLVLDGHSKAAATSLLALPRGCVLHVAAGDEDCLCFASRRVTRRLRQPRQTSELREWLLPLYASERYDLVIPSTETSLLAVMPADLDPQLRARCVIAPESSLATAMDKQATMDLARRLGVHVPSGHLAASMDDAVEPHTWPVVAKPIHSKVTTSGRTLSLAPRICPDAASWRTAMTELLPWSPVLTQAYFAGHGVGVEALFEHGTLRWLFAHRRVHEWPVTGGASTYRRAIPVPPKLQRASQSLLEHLHWHGVAMVEFKLADNGDYRLMEINPRLWGSLPLAVGAGVNFPLGLLHIATGQPVGAQPKYRKIHARDVAKDLHWFEDTWRERRNPLRIAPLRAADFAGWLRPLVGRERWDLFHWRESEMWRASLRPALSGIRARLRRLALVRRSRANWRRLAPAWQAGQIPSVLVLCYGNICRSPAAGLLLQRLLPGVTVRSAGFHARGGRPTPAGWGSVADEILGISLDDHRSEPVNAAMLAEARLVLVMDGRNWQMLAERFPDALPQTVLLGPASSAGGPAEIPDPYDLDPSEMRAIADQLAACCRALAAQHPTPSPRA